jgi:hypothetical protein
VRFPVDAGNDRKEKSPYIPLFLRGKLKERGGSDEQEEGI